MSQGVFKGKSFIWGFFLSRKLKFLLRSLAQSALFSLFYITSAFVKS